VTPGDIVQLGRQFLVFRAENENYFFIHYNAGGQPVNRYPLPEGTVEIGKSTQIPLDPNDTILSRLHLAITRQNQRISMQDLNSTNGSFLKVRTAVRLQADDQFRAGQQVFRFNLQREESRYSVIYKTPQPDASPQSKSMPPQPKPAQPQPQQPPAPAPPPTPADGSQPAAGAAPKAEGMVVMFKNAGKSCPYKRNQTICELAEKNGVTIKADCHEGDCGSDPIRVLAGGENLSPVGGIERVTLEDKKSLAPGEYRLACVAKLKGHGPVVVEIL
jgi:ferredoxin